MPNTIDRAPDLIQARLGELETEAEQLEQALRQLSGLDGAGPSAGPARRKSARRRTSKRAPRRQRRQQFLAALEKTPGAKASEIAKQIGISSNQAYTVARRLQREGSIRKRGKGYRVTTKAGA